MVVSEHREGGAGQETEDNVAGGAGLKLLTTVVAIALVHVEVCGRFLDIPASCLLSVFPPEVLLPLLQLPLLSLHGRGPSWPSAAGRA